MPSIAAGAWRDWAAKPDNLDLLRRFYAANLDAAELVKREPEKAAALIEQGTGISRNTLLYYFAHFGSLIDIRPIADDREVDRRPDANDIAGRQTARPTAERGGACQLRLEFPAAVKVRGIAARARSGRDLIQTSYNGASARWPVSK